MFVETPPSRASSSSSSYSISLSPVICSLLLGRSPLPSRPDQLPEALERPADGREDPPPELQQAAVLCGGSTGGRCAAAHQEPAELWRSAQPVQVHGAAGGRPPAQSCKAAQEAASCRGRCTSSHLSRSRCGGTAGISPSTTACVEQEAEPVGSLW